MAVYISVGGVLFTGARAREGLIRSIRNYFQLVVAEWVGGIWYLSFSNVVTEKLPMLQ